MILDRLTMTLHNPYNGEVGSGFGHGDLAEFVGLRVILTKCPE